MSPLLIVIVAWYRQTNGMGCWLDAVGQELKAGADCAGWQGSGSIGAL